jgi:gas vesicle protein
MTQTRKIILGAIIGVLVIISAATYLYIENKNAKQERLEIWQSQKDFETLLNAFILDIDAQAKAYKKQRRVVAELIQIDNLRDPAYVSENYTMMVSTIVQMRQNSQSILREFEIMDTNVKALIERAHLQDKATIIDAWSQTKDEQFKFYARFFKTEDRILQIYETLMQFYSRNTDHFSVDLSTQSIIFTKPVLKARHDSLLAILSKEKAKQNTILKMP